MKCAGERGLTLMEVLIAVSLLSLMSIGMLIALRVSLSALSKANAKLVDNRRVAGTQRILEQQIAGFMPVIALCGSILDPRSPKTRLPFFQGEPQAMRFVSTYSLSDAWRGAPQILEFLVIARPDNKGVRLIVNEHRYFGPLSAGAFCLGMNFNPALRVQTPAFPPIEAGPRSFVLADRLAYCRFSYLLPAPPPQPDQWRPVWPAARWPPAIRVEMAPFEEDAARLRPVTVTAPLHVTRSLEIEYGDW